jgi:hypothetical protein
MKLEQATQRLRTIADVPDLPQFLLALINEMRALRLAVCERFNVEFLNLDGKDELFKL